MQDSRAVTREEGSALARTLGTMFFECSAKTKVGVQNAFEELLLKVGARASLAIAQAPCRSLRGDVCTTTRDAGMVKAPQTRPALLGQRCEPAQGAGRGGLRVRACACSCTADPRHASDLRRRRAEECHRLRAGRRCVRCRAPVFKTGRWLVGWVSSRTHAPQKTADFGNKESASGGRFWLRSVTSTVPE